MVMVEKLTMMVYPEMYKLLLCPRHWMQFWLGLLWLPGRSNHTSCTCFSVSLFVTISICLTFCLSLFPSLYLPIELTEFWDVLASLEEPPVTHWLIFKTLDLSQSHPNRSQICLNVSPICPNWWPNLRMAQSGGQMCNSCKWFQLVAKFTIYKIGAICWKNLQPMQVVPPDGVIWNWSGATWWLKSRKVWSQRNHDFGDEIVPVAP